MAPQLLSYRALPSSEPSQGSQNRPKKPNPSEDLPDYPSLRLNITFESLEEAKNTITDAITEANQSFKVKNAMLTFWTLECRSREDHRYKFTIRVSLKGKPRKQTLGILQKHTCPSQCHDGWQRIHSTKFLARKHFDLVANNRKLLSKFVQDEARLKQGNKISSRQAYRTAVEVRSQIKGEQSKQFQYMKSLLLAIRDHDIEDHEFECIEPDDQWAELCD